MSEPKAILPTGHFIQRRPSPPLLHLLLDGLQNGANVRLQDHPPHHYFIQHVMDTIGMKDQVQFTHVLKALVQSLDEDLDQIQYPQVGLLRVDGEDKVQRRVVAVDQLDVLTPFRNDPLEVVAKRIGPRGDLGEDPPNNALLLLFRFDRVVEFDHPRFPVIVDDDYTLDHNRYRVDARFLVMRTKHSLTQIGTWLIRRFDSVVAWI